MQVNLLDISSVNAQLDISSTSPKIMVHNSGKTDLTIERQKGGLKMSSQPLKIQMDNTESRAALNIKSVSRVISEEAQTGMQSLLETIGRYAQQGDMLMDVKSRSGALHQIAVQRTIVRPQGREIPSLVLPDISWKKNSLTIDYTPDKIVLHPDNSQKADISLQRGNVDIRLARAAQVYIKYVGPTGSEASSQKMDTGA